MERSTRCHLRETRSSLAYRYVNLSLQLACIAHCSSIVYRCWCWCYKIVFGLVYVNLDDLFVFSPCQYTRGHKFKLYKRQTVNCVGLRANFFSERVINCWNSLPHTVDFSSFSKFKRSVKRVDFTDFFQILMYII